MQLYLRGLRVAARQLQLQARIVSFQDGDSSLELRLFGFALCLQHTETSLELRLFE